jgi:hypothetical protein
MRCYGCFKIDGGEQDFCDNCQKLLFNSKNISSRLPFLSEQAKIVYKKDIRQSLDTILRIKVGLKSE